MSKEYRSGSLLHDFEPSAVRLKRKLRLILSKTLRRNKLAEENITLTEFTFYLVFLTVITTMCIMHNKSEDILNSDRCIRQLLIKKLELDKVKTVDEFWNYLDRLNKEIYINVIKWNSLNNNTVDPLDYQLLLLNENFILGYPRLRQIRVDDSHCHVVSDLSIRKIKCYAPYDKSNEYQDTFISVTDYRYDYTLPSATSALKLSNVFGPYNTGGFIYYFRPIQDLNDRGLTDLKEGAWLDLGTRAIFIEMIYFNPNTELLTSINILFEFLTTGTVEYKDFFYTLPMSSYFFGRNKIIGIFQVSFALFYIAFAFYFVGKMAEHRLLFIMVSYWNLYDLILLILFTILIYYDINYLVYVSPVFKSLGQLKNDFFKDLIRFIEIQINRNDLQAYVASAFLLRLLRFLPHCSNLIRNLLDALYRSIRNSISFILLFFFIFMSFVIFATYHYGDELYEFHTFALTSYTLIRCTLGQFEYDRLDRVSPKWTPVFYMLYVCVVYFILLNLLVAIISEAYILCKQEQKQIEDDLKEEYKRGTNRHRVKAYHRSKRPVLQVLVLRYLNHFLKFIFNQSINIYNDMDDDDNDNDEDDNNDDDNDDDDNYDEVSLREQENLIKENLKRILLNDGYNIDVVAKFFHRLSFKNNNDDSFLFELEPNESIEILYDEFKTFNNQYEKLEQDWRRTMATAQEMILSNTIDIEQASITKQHINILDERVRNLENLIPKALDNIVKLYTHQSEES